MKEETKCHRTYYGAANGYSGFRSNFDKIFSSDNLDKLFIIKGGPGTGKSTLMRRVKEKYAGECDITTILCSSDPASLDGVLIKKNGKTVGIADGTSPHVIEPIYPGATEEIVNLGEAFNFDALHEKKKTIQDLSSNKKSHYNAAYSSLKIAGSIYDYITRYFLNSRCYTSAENEILKWIEKDDTKEYSHFKSNFLIGSFSKNGYKRINLNDLERETILIKGDGISEYIFMSLITEVLKNNEVSHSIFSSAFSSEIPDAIMIDKVLYIITDDKEHTINATKFVPQNCEYDRLKSSHRCFIENAQLSLIKASEYHFKLESIYSSAMSFNMNEEKYLGITTKIDALFDK